MPPTAHRFQPYEGPELHGEPEHHDANAASTLARARFLTGARDLRHLPPDDGWEVAFAGRSNTGKSSVINTLCRQKALARTSRTPGRTQQMVVFRIDERRRLVDLPGFGYAKVPASLRAHWGRVVTAYLERRRSLAGVVLVVDARHALKAPEHDLLAWCEAAQVSLYMLLNKVDKLSRSQARAALARARDATAALACCAGVQLFSAVTSEGVDEARSRLAAWLSGE